ncbi:MAG: hypothetical protein Q7V20_07330 [Aquabacterium sp.]|nr:hypothetical protein [Aquabacterium sp.]MDO9003246.1 hypothetical protein [Aquabacterium sp.]
MPGRGATAVTPLPSLQRTCSTVPSDGASTGNSIFMDSTTARVWPSVTALLQTFNLTSAEKGLRDRLMFGQAVVESGVLSNRGLA